MTFAFDDFMIILCAGIGGGIALGFLWIAYGLMHRTGRWR